MAAYRKRNNPRLPDEWALHLARHGARQVEGGWVWKADPMFGIGIPSEFNVAMLEAEMRRVQCPVLVLTGDQEDTWRELDARRAGGAGRVAAAPATRWSPAPATTSTSRTPTRRCATSRSFLAEVGP